MAHVRINHVHEHLVNLCTFQPAADVVDVLKGSGFENLLVFSKFKSFKICHDLVSVIVQSYETESGCFKFSDEVNFYLSLVDIFNIWGLPITGKPVIADECHGEEIDQMLFPGLDCHVRRRGFKNEKLRNAATNEENNLAIRVRATVLYLLGSIFVPEGAFAKAIYGTFLQDIDRIKDYAWGEVMLVAIHEALQKFHAKHIKEEEPKSMGKKKELKTKSIGASMYTLCVFMLLHVKPLRRKFGIIDEDFTPTRWPVVEEVSTADEARKRIKEKSDPTTSDEQKIQYSKYLIEVLLPFIRQINKEQLEEKKVEATIQGKSMSDVQIKQIEKPATERIYCNICRTSIVDYHRRCDECLYEVCLSCCNRKRRKRRKRKECKIIRCPEEHKKVLELSCLLSDGYVSNMIKDAEEFLAHEKDCVPESLKGSCTCSKFLDGDHVMSQKICKAASREDPKDNTLYRPSAIDIEHGDLKHFQWHLSNGEPVIVSNVLETTLGLSWEPTVMFGALRQDQELTTINCRTGLEEPMEIQQFFRHYYDPKFNEKGYPEVLKVKDWPQSASFEEMLPRHGIEFISCLPFKEYTHPHLGYLNLASKLPSESLKTDMGPKTYMAYGSSTELTCEDSVTKLHLDMSDAVYAQFLIQ